MSESKNVKNLRKQLMAAIAMVMVAAVALGSSTYAWFVSNTQVQANASSVSATSATPNLLIVNGATSASVATVTGGGTVATLATASASALYPVSTDDATNWYAVSGWKTDSGAVKANAYFKPTITTPGFTGIGVGTYSVSGKTLNAYQAATYSVYTTTGSVDLCLDPANPITVTVDTAGLKNTATGFKDSLRVGIVVNGALKVVYVPTAETKSGNDSAYAGTGKYKSVTGTTSDKVDDASYTTLVGSTFTGWIATDNGNGTYTKPTNTLGTVSTTGAVVQVYVWMEGTDADCLVGTADSATDDNTYKVALNFVGAAS